MARHQVCVLVSFVCFVSFVVIPPSARAQQPAVEANVNDQAEVQPLPELPETVVTGDLSFPAQPLPDDTVVSPNRVPTPLDQTGSSVTVIDQQEIAASTPISGQTTVAEILRGKPGVDVVRQGGPGSISSVFLRGANSQHTKVLVDGIPVNDPSNATRGFDFSTLSIDNVERVEVLRGPQSMVYGSDAIGGVINIITRRGEGPLTTRTRAFGGTYDTGEAALNVSGGDDVRYYSVTGSYFSTGGISAAAERLGNTERDAFNLGTASGRFGYNASENWNVDYVFRYADSIAEIDDVNFLTGLPFDNPLRKNRTQAFYNRVQLSNSSVDDLVYQRVGFNLVDYARQDEGSPQVFIPTFDGQTREIDYYVRGQLLETNAIAAGANYLAEDASTGGFFGVPHAAQNIKGVFLQDEFQLFENFYGTAGVRWDETSRAGPAETYRVTGLYRIDELGTALHGSIGTGFRQPALAEILPGFGGNPDLRPERSKGWDIGGRQAVLNGDLVFDATYYRNDFDDLIVFDFTVPPFGALANIGQARSSGVELTMLYYFSDVLWLDAAYTSDQPRNLDTGTLLLRRPRDKVLLSLTRDIPDYGTTVSLQMRYVGDRLDTGNSTLEDYTLLDLAVNSQLTDGLEGFLRLNNLTDEEYEEVRGFGTPGFAVYGGLNLIY